MEPAKRYIKYMVSLRCKMVAKKELENMGFQYEFTPQDALVIHEDVSEDQLDKLNEKLQRSGLELLDEKNSMLMDRIINMINDTIHKTEELPNIDFEDVISKNIVPGNDQILKIFSDVTGVSIIQFIINQKIERVKELLLYENLSLSEISERLRYKNKDYLIAQFKKHTGLSPTYYKKLRNKRNSILQET